MGAALKPGVITLMMCLLGHCFLAYSEQDNSPEPPSSLTAHSVKDSSSKIDLTWVASPRKNGHEILAYSVHYLPTKGGEEMQKVVIGTSVTIDNLMPHTSYTFYVVAYNEMSASEHSLTATAVTGEDDDSPEPPSSLTAHSVKDSSSKIDLTWVASPTKNGHEILAYSVQYLPTKGGEEMQKVVIGTSVTIDNLMPHTSYTFYVVAYNEMSASEHSLTATAVTGEDA